MISLIVEQSGRTVVARILKQDVSLRSKDSGLQFRATNGMAIVSSAHPELRKEGLYIQGSSATEDENWVLKEFDSKALAKEYYKKLLEALKEWKEAGYRLEPR